MEIKLTNIGILDFAEIRIDGITVIAGLNGTGKSTVLKSVFSVAGASTDILENSDFQYLENEKNTGMLIDRQERKSNGSPLYKTNLIRMLRSVFHGQVLKISSESGTIEMTDDKGSVVVYIDPTGMEVEGTGVNISTVSYIDTPLVLDYAAESLTASNENIHRNLLIRQLTAENNNTSAENPKKIRTDEIYRLLSKIIKGSFKRQGHGFFYSTEDRRDIHVSNMASGIKIFSILKILMDNGRIGEGSLLLLDNPETYLHPKWQLILAEILTLTNKNLGTRIVLTTQSPQLLASIEAYCEKELVEVDFYNFKEVESGHYVSENVTGNRQKIYRPMAEAFNETENVVYTREQS